MEPSPSASCKDVGTMDAKIFTGTERVRSPLPVFDENVLTTLFYTCMEGAGSCEEDKHVCTPLAAGIFGYREVESELQSPFPETMATWLSSVYTAEKSICTQSLCTLENGLVELERNLSFITDGLAKLETFFQGCEVNIEPLAYRLVGTTWKVENPIFCLNLLASTIARSKIYRQSEESETDKKADSESHFHGLRLPPPSTYRLFVISLIVATISSSVIGGVNTDVFLVNCGVTRGGRSWKKQGKSLNEVCRPGEEQAQNLEERLGKSISKSENSLRRTLNAKRRQVQCYSKSTLSSLKKDTSKLLVSFLCLPFVCSMLPGVRKGANKPISKKVRSRRGY